MDVRTHTLRVELGKPISRGSENNRGSTERRHFLNIKQKNMGTTKKHLISIRSNTKFAVDYGTKLLTPEIELILISIEPKYEAKKDGIHKGNEVSEFRIFSDMDGVNKLIGELKLLVAGMQKYEQLSAGINSLIEQAKKDQ